MQLNEAASKAATEAVKARSALEPHKVLLDAARVAADEVVAKTRTLTPALTPTPTLTPTPSPTLTPTPTLQP